MSPMTGRRIAVLVADDSALYRQMLLNVLSHVPGVDVVGVAHDGLDAVAQAESLRPDVVTLDVSMPRLDGLGALRELRRRGSRAKVIMVSSLTSEGSPATVEALMEGAFDFVTKPAGLETHQVRAHIHAALLEKIAAIVDARTVAAAAAMPPAMEHATRDAAAGAPRAVAAREGRFDVVAIGTSTGGPQALTSLLPALPADLPSPVIVVQHMPAGFTAQLATRLDELSRLRVVEAADGMPVAPGTVYIAPGGAHMRIDRAPGGGFRCVVHDGPHRLGCRPSFDTLLESLAPILGAKTLAVVLTGIGRDGVEGCTAIRREGGYVVAQAAAGCAVYGMPKAVAEEGLADSVLPLDDIAAAIARVVGRRLRP
jgi:two-component system chemotaxis response regulator CheB